MTCCIALDMFWLGIDFLRVSVLTVQRARTLGLAPLGFIAEPSATRMDWGKRKAIAVCTDNEAFSSVP